MKLETCFICDHIKRADSHCPVCGAYFFIVNNKPFVINRFGIELARGIPRRVHNIISQFEVSK